MDTKHFQLSIQNKRVTLPMPCVMGIINCSSLSFYQSIPDVPSALKKVEEMVEAGVSIVDVGAVATNPSVDMHVDQLSVQAECDRVVAIIEAIRASFDVLISVDTCQPDVMKAAVSAGADIINDQRTLHEQGAREAVAALQVPVCLMHHFEPIRTPDSSTLEELMSQIISGLENDVQLCEKAGITRDRIIIDPGFGGGYFGKSAKENFYILSHLSELNALGLPILVGMSRKSMFGDLFGLSVTDRSNVSVAAATVAALNGAAIIRAHDVKETVEAMNLVRALQV